MAQNPTELPVGFSADDDPFFRLAHFNYKLAETEPPEVFNLHDKRMAAKLRSAMKDPDCRSELFFEKGVMLCALRGLPLSMSAMLSLAADLGIKPHPSQLRDLLLRETATPMANAGRMQCLELAVEAGFDPGEPYVDLQGMRHCFALDVVMDMELDNLIGKNSFDKGSFEERALLLKKLIGWGCDPMDIVNPGGRWSFGANSPGRDKLPASIQALFEEIDAMMEANALRAMLPAGAPSTSRLRA